MMSRLNAAPIIRNRYHKAFRTQFKPDINPLISVVNRICNKISENLPAFVVEAQYAVRAVSDPFDRGGDLFGSSHMQIKDSLSTHHPYIELTWYARVAAIVIGHVAAILVVHIIASI